MFRRMAAYDTPTKVMLGCLAGFVLAMLMLCGGVGVVSFAGYLMSRKSMEAMNAYQADVEHLQAVGKANPFTKPEGDALDAERFEVFLAVHHELGAKLIADQIEEKVQAAENRRTAASGPLGSLTTMGPYLSAFFSLENLPEFLEKHGSSAGEFSYYFRATCDAAAGADPEAEPELVAFWESVKAEEQKFSAMQGALGGQWNPGEGDAAKEESVTLVRKAVQDGELKPEEAARVYLFVRRSFRMLGNLDPELQDWQERYPANFPGQSAYEEGVDEQE